ncbi:MAG: hypothetical protein ACUVUF_08925 [Candidatus Bathycorpusculaceae bacterium]
MGPNNSGRKHTSRCIRVCTKHLKGIVHVLTEPVGKEINNMEPFSVAETWMFMFDLYASVSGKIVKVNEKLKNEPNIINEDPYNEG